MIDPSRPAMRAEFSGQVKSVPDGDDIILCADDGFDELTDAPPKPWLIKNVIARGETSSWIAPPGLTDAPPKPWLIKNVIARGETSSWIAPPGPLSTPHIAGLHGFGGEASAGGGCAALSQCPNLLRLGSESGAGFLHHRQGSLRQAPVAERPVALPPENQGAKSCHCYSNHRRRRALSAAPRLS
jgi:hypothetical protein